MSSVKKNFLYSILYQMLVLIVPLITTPYVSRTVGAEGIGVYTYTYSIAYYFVLIAMLGINNYGNRTIAKVRDDKEKMSDTFISIYTLQFVMSMIMIFIYVIYVLFFANEYKWMHVIQMIYMISVIFDINWFYFGLEKFKITITRNIIIKIISTIFIFVFVKERADLWKYTIIMTTSTLITQMYLWVILKKNVYISKERIQKNYKDALKHLKPTLILFIPVIAVSLYKIMDKIMLGNLNTMTEVGLYENSEKIVNIPLGLINALGTIMLPRMSNIIVNGKKKEMHQYINKSMEFVMFLSCPIAFGIMAIGHEFAPLFFGEEFIRAGQLISCLAVTTIFISWANVIRTQYLIPMERDKIYLCSVILGAIVNFIFNIILIPKLNALGAVIGTIVAEFTVMITQTIAIRKELPIKQYIAKSIRFMINAIIMYIVLFILERIIENKVIGWTYIMIEIVMGILIYCILNIKYIRKNIKI
ncbi:MAG: flippase [Clostridia bacterium]|nr:flippase [Clostridia bacterium]